MMKPRTVRLVTGLLGFTLVHLGGCATPAGAQSEEAGTGQPSNAAQPETARPADTARHSDKAQREVLLDNDRVRVVESTYPVGTGVPTHEHRFPQVLYTIEGGTVQTTAPDGAVNTLALREGEALWREPQSHESRNVGDTPVKIVEVEVKDTRLALQPGQVVAATPDALQWVRDPEDPARTMALVVGDPTEPGPYTARLRSPAGYAIALHQHPGGDELVTVLSGTLNWSTGAEGSGEPEHAAPPGSILVIPAGTWHRLWSTEPIEVQLTGVGPRTYVYRDPAKDPRGQP